MDERLLNIEREKQNALNQSNNMYNNLLTDNQNLYKEQQNYANQQETIQNNVLNQQLNLQRQEIQNQKNEANKNYQNESKRAKNDYTSFINPYGVGAEAQAGQGLLNSGLSETSKLGGWNTYQNRLANANQTLQNALAEYDKSMNEAMVNYDVQKAQNALKKLELMMGYSQNFYDNKSTISQNKLSNNQSLNDNYYNRYQNEYSNIQQEKERAEAIRQWEAEMAEKRRQYDANMAWQKEQARIAQNQWEREYELSKQNYNSTPLSDGGSGGTSLSDGSLNVAKKNNFSPVAKGEPSYTPNLSTRNYEWYNSTFGTNSYTEDELNQLIARGIFEGKIADEDANRIKRAYGYGH